MEANAIEGEDRIRPLAEYQLRLARWKLLQLTNMWVNAFEETAAGKMLRHGIAYDAADVITVERLCHHLHGEHVVVLVEDQAGQQVGFAEDDAVGIRIAGELLAKLHSAVDPLAQKWQ